MRRVVITGLGPVTASGIGKQAFWANLLEGRSAIGRITAFDASRYDSQMAGEVKEFDAARYVPFARRRQCDRFTHLALAAATLALEDAALDLEKEDLKRVGSMVANNLGGVDFGETELYNLYRRGESDVSPYQAIAWFYTATQGQLSLQLGLLGHSKTFSADRIGGHHAVGEAYRAIQRGRLDVALAGGTEAGIRPYGFVGYMKTGLLSRRNDAPARAYRPFDLMRDGLVFGEGGAFLVLEEMERALRRGARIYAEIVGYASTSDGAHHWRAGPDVRQAARALRMALAESGEPTDAVGYVAAAADGDPAGDRRETAAIKEAFGRAAARIPVSAPKAMFGHLYAGAGPVDLAVNALVHETGRIPPTINYEFPDPQCDLCYVPNRAASADVDVAVVNGMGHGGIYAALVTRRLSARPRRHGTGGSR